MSNEKRFDDLNNTNNNENVNSNNDNNSSVSSNRVPKEAYFETKVDGKVVLTEDKAFEATAFAYSTYQKYLIVTVIVIVQISMNYNTSVYPNSVTGMAEDFEISEQAARVGQMIFLVAYAFGCELWAPWSEEFGRWPILQLSLFFVNIWCILAALAPNIGSMIVARFLGGISSAGGSVTLGMVADMWDADNHQFAVAYVVWSSVTGTTIGPVIGGFIQQFAPTWRWIFWSQLIFGGATQVLHFVAVPETRSTILLDREAKKRRKQAEKEGKELNIWGPNEVKTSRISIREILVIWYRPFEMFIFEPIVLCFSLLSGFSDMLIFIFLESFNPVFAQWNFSAYQTGLAFVSILIGYFLGWFSFIPFIIRDEKRRKADSYGVAPETRLFWLLFTAPLETIGLFGFAWCSLGPPVHWMGCMIFAACIAIANYAIYMATIDYMIAAYGQYSASATGGNGFARDFLAGISAMFATPFYEHFNNYTLEYPSTILACLAFVVAVPIYIAYWKGPEIRRRSKFAMTLASERETMKVKSHVRDEKSKSQHIEHKE